MTDEATDRSDSLAGTPPMGWNSWNAFEKEVDAERIERQADAMVDLGMAELGYEYVVVDGGWRAPTRDDEGNMQVDREAFPDGIAGVADYVHDLGLELGLHQAVGMEDCAGETPGTQSAPGGESQDADLFAEWGIDLLKYDLCRYEFPEGPASRREVVRRAYERMGEALAATDRDIVYCVSEYGQYRPWEWARAAGAHTWRTTPDIRDAWAEDGPFHESVTSILDQSLRLAEYAGPGGWNDPDMLEVGNGGMTAGEYRAHFSAWAVLGAPLFAGTDLTDLSSTAEEILLNEALVAVNQDPLGAPGERVRGTDAAIWAKPLAGGGAAAVLLNRRETEAEIRTSASELGVREASTYRVRDLWTDERRQGDGALAATVPPHDCVVYRVEPA